MTGYRVERVSEGHDRRADDVRAFWSRHAALGAEEVERRLPLVAGLVLDEHDAVAGTCSVVDTAVPLVGDRRFWLYRRLLGPDVPEGVDDELFLEVFRALDDDHEPGADRPIGVCVVDRPRAEAVLPGTELLLAGYTKADEQVRLRYFEGARIR